MNDKVQKLYNHFKSIGATKAKDAQQFATWMKGENYRKNIYGILSEAGAEGIGKDFDEFSNITGYGTTKKVTSQAVDFTTPKTNGSTTPSRRPTWQETMAMGMTANQAMGTAYNATSGIKPNVKPGLDTGRMKQDNALANSAIAQNADYASDNIYLDELESKAVKLQQEGQKEVEQGQEDKGFLGNAFDAISGARTGVSQYQQNLQSNEKMRQGTLMQKNVEDARKAIKDAEISQNKSWYEKLGRGLANGFDIRNFDGGVTNLQNMLTLNSSATSNTPTEAQQAVLDSEALKNKIISENEQKISNWITSGETTTMMFPFMIQIAGNPVKGIGEATSKWMLGKMGQQVATNLGKRAALLALKGSTRLLGTAIEGAGANIAFNSANILSDTFKRNMGNAVGEYGSDGVFHYKDMNDGEDSIGTAFAKAFGASTIEYQSELVGEYFAPLLKGLGKATSKGLQKAGVLSIKKGNDVTGNAFKNIALNLGGKSISLDKTIGLMTSLSNKQYMKAFNDFRKATHYDGVIGEYAEEVVGNIENAALVGDMNFGTGENGVFNPEQNWETFMSVAVGSAFMGALGGVSYIGSRIAVNKGYKQADRQGYDWFGADAWESIKDNFETSSNPAKTAAALTKNLDDESKRVVQNYIGFNMAKKGELIANMKQRMEEPQPSSSRVVSYKGKYYVQSLDENNNVLESKEYDNEEDANMYKFRVSAYIDNNKKVAQFNDFLIRDEDGEAATKLGITDELREALKSIAYTDPFKRTEIDQDTFDTAINLIQKVIYPANEVNEEHEAQMGADLAGDSEIVEQTMADEVNGRESAARQQWGEIISREPYIDTLVANWLGEGKSANEIAQRLKDDFFSPEIVEAFCEMCNAKAFKEAFIEKIGDNINLETDKKVGESLFAGTINGKNDANNVYQLTDGLNSYTLVGGDVQLDENGAVSSDELVILRDQNGEFVQKTSLEGMQIQSITPVEQFKQTLQGVMQEDATERIIATQYEEPAPATVQTVTEEKPEETIAEPVSNGSETSAAYTVDENENPIYHQMPLEDTIKDLYNGELTDDEIMGFVQSNIDESQKEYNAIQKKAPKISTNKKKYIEEKNAHKAQVEETKKRLDYWNNVKQYINEKTKTTDADIKAAQDELTGVNAQLAYAKNQPTEITDPVQRAGQFIKDTKITPESFKAETGFGVKEQQSFTGMISKSGKTIDQIAEDLAADDMSTNNGVLFHGDSTEAKNAILEALQGGRQNLGKNTSDQFKTFEQDYVQQREDFYQETYHQSYEDFLADEEQIMPNIWRKTTNFVPEEYDQKMAEIYEMQNEVGNVEQINNENNGNYTTGTRQLEGSIDVLPTKAPVQQTGTTVSQDTRTETADGRESGIQNEEVQGSTPGAINNSAFDNTTDTGETVGNGKLNDTATQQNTVSDSQDTTISDTNQGNQQKVEEKTEEKAPVLEASASSPQQNTSDGNTNVSNLPSITEADIDADEKADETSKELAKEFLRGENTGTIAELFYRDIAARVHNNGENKEDMKPANQKPTNLPPAAQAAINDGKLIIGGVPESKPKTEKPKTNTPKQEKKSDTKQAFDEFKDVMKKFRDAGRADANVSLVGLNARQIEMLADVFRVTAKLGYAMVKDGATAFNDWLEKMRAMVGDTIKENSPWNDQDITDLLTETWNNKYLADGVRKPLSEWAAEEALNTEQDKENKDNRPATVPDNSVVGQSKFPFTKEELESMTKEQMISAMWQNVFPVVCEKYKVPSDTMDENAYWFAPKMTTGYPKDSLVAACMKYMEHLNDDVATASEKQMNYIMSLAAEDEKQLFKDITLTKTAASRVIDLLKQEENMIYGKAGSAEDFDEIANELEKIARLNGADLSQKDQKKSERRFVDNVAKALNNALETGEKPFKSIVDLRKAAIEAGMQIEEGKDDIKIQELVEDALVKVARDIMNAEHVRSLGSLGNKFPKTSFDKIKRLYDLQPTIAQRSSERIRLQQYSTPLPMAYVADMFIMKRMLPMFYNVLEPTAGNGMLVFGIPSRFVHANEIDKNRLANLRGQDFKSVTEQDATKPFEGGKIYNAVVANPPFGSAEAKEYDGKMISGLDPQIAINALESMKDKGRAAIIIGGKTEFRDNGAIKNNVSFLTYLYDHYNVQGVIDMEGQLYAKQGTTYPTRMILIDGRRSEEERAKSQVYPPVKDNWTATATTFDELYDTVNNIINSKQKTNGTEILRAEQQPVPVSDRPSGQTNVGRPAQQLGEGNQKVDSQRRGLDSRPENVLGESVGRDRGDRRGTSDGRGRDLGLDFGDDQHVERQGSTSSEPSQLRGSGRGTGTAGRGGTGESEIRGRVDSTVHTDGNTGTGSRTVLKQEEKRGLDTEKLPYRPHNSAFSLESVAPSSMVEAMDNYLKEIEKEFGNIDDFVTKELGYNSVEEMQKALAAEQVDSVAMAIYQMKNGQAMIIGDQTGVGKGRQMAALIRWATMRGKQPIFITKDANLFTDIYRDLVDIGSGDLKPFIFNDAGGENPGVMVDSDGNVVYKALPRDKQKKILEGNELPPEYDFAVLSYSQVNSGDEISAEEAHQAAKKNGSRKKKKEGFKNPPIKARFLRKIAKDNYMLLDESHTAAGESNTGYYLQSLVKDAKGVTFASATFAKRPDTMPIYAIKTAMSKANVAADELIGIIKKGGVTLQEIMSRALTSAGQMVRRERDMTGVVTDWVTVTDDDIVKYSRENYDKSIVAFNAIIDYQENFVTPAIDKLDKELATVASTASTKKGTKKMGIDNPPFVNKAYSYTKQLMLTLKANAIVDRVEQEIKAGKHPVIALESTMESALENYAVGETVTDPTFAECLKKGLRKVLEYTIKDGSSQKGTTYSYTPEQIGKEAADAYYKLEDFIRESTKDVFISPLDLIMEKLRRRGYKVGELTGRKTRLQKDENGQYKVVERTKQEKDKKRQMRLFNSGELDVLILNKSASTGVSLHSSKTFKDQRQRSMIIAQPLSDINDYMQMIGRIDRTGQVHRGYYVNLGLPVPAEQRFLMMLSTKLKSLNANTTTSQDSESNSVDAPDLLNKYGSQVVVEYLKDNPDIYVKLGEPLSKGQNGTVKVKDLDKYVSSEEDARKITGRVALLSSKEQEDFYNDVINRYNSLIKYLDETGSNDLKITVMPLRAKTIEKRVSSKGVDPNGTNPFAKDAYVEKVEMDVLRKPMKAAEVKKTISNLANGMSPNDAVQNIISTVEKETVAKLEKEAARYEKAKAKAEENIAKQIDRINNNKKLNEQQKKERIEEIKNESAQNLEDTNIDNQNKINENESLFIRRLAMFKVGNTYLIPDDLTKQAFVSTSPAIFCGFKAKKEGLTPSTTLAVFAVLDGRRRIEIKLSDLNPLLMIKNQTESNYAVSLQTDLTNWDESIPTNSRKVGYIMTGNILQAVADTQTEDGSYTGQLISYTDIDGNVHDGILMPDKWEPSLLKNSGVPINSRLQQLKNGERIVSSDGKVEIFKDIRYGIYTLLVPKSKKEGGKYYQNDDILKHTGRGEFYPYRGKLAADIPERSIDALLNELSNMGVRVAETESNTRAYKNENNVNDARIIPEDVDKSLSLQIENEFDSEIEKLNLTDEEKNELENKIREYSSSGTIKLEDDFYLNNARLGIRNEKKDYRHGSPRATGMAVPEATNVAGDNLRKTERAAEPSTSTRGESSAMVQSENGNAERRSTEKGNAVQGQSSSARYSGNANNNRLLLQEGRRIAKEILSKNSGAELSSRQRRILATQFAISREILYRDARMATIKENTGLEAGKQTSLDDIAAIFEKTNTDKEVKALFDKILAVNKRLGTTIDVQNSQEQGFSGAAGTRRDVHYYLDGFTRTSAWKINIPVVLAHELLHQGTMGAINIVRKGKAEGILTKEQIDAVNTILDIYNKVSSNPQTLAESKRGLADPYEFAAQMVDPRQRRALSMTPLERVMAAANELKAQSNTSLWDRIKNALKKLFGMSDLKQMDKAINTLLDTFNETVHDISMTDVDQNSWGYKIENEELLDKLNSEPTVKVYRAMQVIDGKLYPPMAAKVNGSLVEPTEVGEWYGADEHPELIIPDGTYKDGTPKYKFKLDKGGNDATGKKATDVAAAYNPYWHTSRSPINDQFKSAWIRPNLVTVEVEVPESELTSGYKAQYAKDAVGEVDWKSGSVSGKLAKLGNPRKVILSRYNRVVRVVPVDEVADRFKEMLEGTGIEIPENTVTPQLREALEAKGVQIGAPEKGVNKNTQIEEALAKGLEVDNTLYRQDDDIVNASNKQIQKIFNEIANNGFNDVTLRHIDELFNDIQNGKAVYNRYNQSETQGLVEAQGALFGASLAASYVAASQGAGRYGKIVAGQSAKEQLKEVKKFAKAKGLWIDDVPSFLREQLGEPFGNGAEAEVYMSPDNLTVIKDKDGFYISPLETLDAIVLHNTLFPDTAMEVIGFGESNDSLRLVVKQPFINIEREATQKEIEDFAAENGLTKNGENYYNEEVNASDFHKGNIVIDKNTGKTVCIDCNITFNSKVQAQGNRIPGSLSYPASPRARRISDETQNQLRSHAEALAKKLNTEIIITTSDQLEGQQATAKGFYNKATGKITIVIDNNRDKLDVEQTILHEIVGHKGLAGLLGTKAHRKLMDVIFDTLSPQQQAEIKEKAMRNGWRYYTAMDEYFAQQAEKMAWNNESHNMWENIKHYVTEAIRKIGFIIMPNYKDIRYWLWLSKNNLNTNDVMSELKRQSLLYKLSRLKAPSFESETMTGEDDIDTLYRNGDIASGAAWQAIEQRLTDNSHYWREAFIDYMNAYKIFQEEMAKGIDGPLMDHMNAYVGENQMSSKVAELQDQFLKNEVKNMEKKLHAVATEFGKGKKGIRGVEQYLIMKHGLERNRVLFMRDWFKANIDKKVENTNNFPPIANDIYEKLVNGIEVQFEDGLIDDAKRKKLLEAAPQTAWIKYVNEAFDGFNVLHSFTSTAVDKDVITLQKMYEDLDSYINQYADFDADKMDKSGLSAMTEYYVNDKYSDSAIIEKVAAIERMLGNSKNELWNALNAVTQKGIDYDYESGIVGEEAYKRAKSMFRWYIPLRGYDKETMEDQYNYMQNSNGIDKKSLVTAKGRTSLAKSPLTIAVAMGLSAIRRGEINKNNQRAYRLVNNWQKNNPDSKAPATVVDVWYEIIGKDINNNPIVRMAVPEINDKMDADEIRQAVDDFNMEMADKQSKGLAKKDKITASFERPFESNNHKNEHIVNVFINGKQKMIVFNGNPRPAQALNGELKPKSSDGVIRKLMNTMAAAFTSYFPTFIATNLSRDTLFANNNIAIKESPRYWHKFTSNQAKLIPGLLPNIFRRDNAYNRLWSDYKEGKEPTTELGRYFVEFMRNGGKTGFINQKKIDEIERMIYTGNKKNLAVKSLSWLGGLIEGMNERVENVNRFAAYVTSKQMGRSVMRSISDAKEASVNFNRKGAGKSTAIGDNASSAAKFAGNVSNFFRLNYLFFNAGIQSFYAFARNGKHHPFKTIAFAMGVPFILGSYMIPMLNKIIAAIAGDDGDEEYANIPEWTRRNNICIYLGHGRWAKIPLPIELRAFYGLGDIAAGYTFDERLQSTSPLPIDIISQLSQILPVDFMGEGGNVLAAFVPDAAKPIVQIMTNTDWTGKPIQKATTPFNQYAPEYTKAFKYEFEPFVDFSKWINNQTGGTDVTKGWADGWWNSPAYWNHLIGGYGGGFVQDIMRTSKLSKRLVTWDWEDASMKEVPILKSLFETPTERTQYYRVMTKFQMYRDEAAQTKYNLNRWKESENPDYKARYFHDTNRATKTNEVRRMEYVDKYLKIEKRLNKIINSPRTTESVKKAKTEELTRRKIELVNQLEDIK